MHKTTLEQWALLEKVVEGSFARAAEETNRSQSSVSYNLALLQERLGVALLAPSGRRAVLTPAGELLLNQVKPLLQAFAYVETHAATLRNGARTRLDLVVDSIFPRQRLFAILRQFQQRYPQTRWTHRSAGNRMTTARADGSRCDGADPPPGYYRPRGVADEY
jgi:DNA-binding transcriptional LysR family regulator